MAVSTVTLAKKIKALVGRHDALVASHNTTEVPRAFQFNFGGELEESGIKMRGFIENMYACYKSAIAERISTDFPLAEDTSREAGKKRIALFAIRALYSLLNSPAGVLRTSYQTRSFGHDEVHEALPDLEFPLIEACLKESAAILQFKRHTDDHSAFNYTWIFAVDGVSVSRGADQPIHKLVTSLIKLIDDETTLGSSSVQYAIGELAKLKGTADPYYWYVSNQDIAMHYLAFSQHRGVTSCMAKEASFYNHTGRGQHPMDCYDDSPDWSLMFLSKYSPEALIEMCDLVIANPDEAEATFVYPFLSRCLVLPTALETSGRMFETPYIFGKFYGEDKLINYFYSDSDSGYYHKNNNQLLSGSKSIDGGRIQVINSTKEGHTAKLLLPYFDRQNQARLETQNGTRWWVSHGGGALDNLRVPIARCAYEYGSAKFMYYYSAGRGQYESVDTFEPETFTTIFGEDLETARRHYIEYDIDGVIQLVPKAYFTKLNGRNVLHSRIVHLYDGTPVASEDVAANPDRYAHINNFGLFDLQLDRHLETHTQLAALTVSQQTAA